MGEAGFRHYRPGAEAPASNDPADKDDEPVETRLADDAELDLSSDEATSRDT